jgi:hypothetical protein
MVRERPAGARVVLLVLASIAAGSLMGGSAVAHTGKLRHLQKHLDGRYVNEDQPAPEADRLDGLDSTAFVQSSAVRSRSWSCPGSAFYPTDSGTGYGGATFRFARDAQDDLRCHVTLPQGATVTSATWYIFDADTTTSIPSCSLARVSLSTSPGTIGTLGTATGTTDPANPGHATIFDTSINNATIENTGFAYYTQCHMSAGDDDISIVGASVLYDVSGADG